ncbi:hypothetical protein SISNIDRAFT_491722 [Sistotremastrum niveocremeum HHB9708]|uniref:Uncharacterized protein n=1 Tax=Sistotremastrum niveocremeum HHB9708 TaxID=1314777 RepID=A0A164MGS0_9AGAM|nr:hypothetical protein SISNIDRAFT_491722 [Sistotremastrum niveocremeum HHB9708]
MNRQEALNFWSNFINWAQKNWLDAEEDDDTDDACSEVESDVDGVQFKDARIKTVDEATTTAVQVKPETEDDDAIRLSGIASEFSFSQEPQHPSISAKSLVDIYDDGAHFLGAVQEYLDAKYEDPLSLQPTDLFDVWHQVHATLPALVRGQKLRITERIQAKPAVTSHIARGNKPEHFDNVLVNVNEKTANLNGVKGYRVARVRFFFKLDYHFFSKASEQKMLVFVRWFSRFPHSAAQNVNMYRIKLLDEYSVIPLTKIRQTVHVVPDFKGARVANKKLTPQNVFQLYDTFFLNDYISREAFKTLM